MRTPRGWFGAAFVGSIAAFAMAQDAGRQQRPSVPIDDLPTPLVRRAPLGAAALEAGFTASDAEVALGRRLFFEPRLSAGAEVACATCHRPEFAFADDRAFSIGVNGTLTTRNSPSLLNKSISVDVLWDGRAATLEEQVLMPIEHPGEMALGIEGALRFLREDPEYTKAFQDVFGEAPSTERLADALAAFVRALSSGDSPVDRFRSGDVAALDPAAEAGLWLFEGKGRCWQCHEGPNFSDERFHNTGIGAKDGAPEEGRFAHTGDEADRGAFRTPGLRMLTKTAPYMHDGSLATLRDVVDYYADGGNANSSLSRKIRPLKLSEQERVNLVAFLEALSVELPPKGEK